MITQDDLDKMQTFTARRVVHADRVVAVEEAQLRVGLRHIVMRWRLASGVMIEVNETLATRVPRGKQVTDGYYLRYPDGFQSWASAVDFESSYVRHDEKETA